MVPLNSPFLLWRPWCWLGRPGEVGDGSANEGLKKILILCPASAVLSLLWRPGMEDRIAQADLITVSQETWALVGVVKGFQLCQWELTFLAKWCFISWGPHSKHNTQFTDKGTANHRVKVICSALAKWSAVELDYKPKAWYALVPKDCFLGWLSSLLLSRFSHFLFPLMLFLLLSTRASWLLIPFHA